MSFWIKRKRDGTLVVPLVAVGNDDLIGDGVIEVKRDASDYKRYFRMYQDDQKAQGLPIPELKKAEPNPQLTPQGRQALAITEALEADIRDEWATLTRNIEKGMPVSAALAQFKQRVMGLIATGMSEAWMVGGEGQPGPAEIKQIDEALASQEDYLNKFIAELIDSLGKHRIEI